MNIFNVDNNVRISTLINVNLSADQWELSTDNFPRHTIEQVATYLNNRFNQGYNKGLTKDQLSAYVQTLMSDFSVYGATDPTSHEVLNTLLEKVYP